MATPMLVLGTIASSDIEKAFTRPVKLLPAKVRALGGADGPKTASVRNETATNKRPIIAPAAPAAVIMNSM